MRSRRERGKGTLDLAHDVERHREGLPPILAAHGHWNLATHGRLKALELETQRLTFRRLEWYALDLRATAPAGAGSPIERLIDAADPGGPD